MSYLFKVILVAILSTTSCVNGSDNFFANEEIQKKAPEAFVLGKPTKVFLEEISRKTFIEADKFIASLKLDPSWDQILRYDKLSIEEQINLLHKIFLIEVNSFDMIRPELSIDVNYPRAAYFDFNLNQLDAGKVYINPKITFNENKFLSLSLLIHETRHSAQLQLISNSEDNRGDFYLQAFSTQKDMFGNLSFSDFLTLNNEFEAFLFANYVMLKIFDGRVDIIDSGTYGSQFDIHGNLKIDLLNLHEKHPDSVLNIFNHMMLNQKRHLEALSLDHKS